MKKQTALILTLVDKNEQFGKICKFSWLKKWLEGLVLYQNNKFCGSVSFDILDCHRQLYDSAGVKAGNDRGLQAQVPIINP